MQELTVVGRLFPLILSGEKRSTIRWREAAIEPGPMRYVNAAEPRASVVVQVTRATTMPLSQAATYLGREADWPREVMLEGMREHYPQIAWHDLVQVIEHKAPDQS